MPVEGGAEIQASSDLTPTAISYSPDGPQTGDTVTFSTTVSNIGGAATGSSFNVALYIDNVNVGTGTAAALAAGATETVNITWTATSELHDVYILADSGSAIGESDENNNRLNSSVGVDWPTQQQSNERRGYANTVGPTTNYLMWSRSIGTIINGYTIAVADGNVYTGGRDKVVAYNAQTGAAVWNSSTGGTFQYPDAHITIANGILYTGTDNTDKKIWAFNASSGSTNWSVAQGGSESGFTAYYQGTVYDSSPGVLQARNPADGSSAWSSNDFSAIWNSPVITNDTLYFVTYNSTADALNAFNGTQVWIKDFSLIGNVYGPPAYAYGNLYFGTSAGSGDVFYSLRASDGATNWSYAYGQYDAASAAVFNQTVFVGAGNSVYARNAITGNSLWTKSLGSSPVAGPVVSSNGIVYVSTADSKIYALNSSSGSTIWSKSTSGISYALALYNNMLYATTENGLIYGFGNQPTITSSQTYNNTIVDRDSVSASTADSVPLTVNLSSGASGVTVTFNGQLTNPSALSGSYSIGTNTTVNGVATYNWNPPSDGSIPAGKYVWSGTATSYSTLDNSTVYVYGGLTPYFRNSTGKPNTNTSYQSGDTVEVDMNISGDGAETTDNLLDYYSTAMTVELRPPTETAVTMNFSNVTSSELLNTGTMNSSCDISDGYYYLAIKEHLVPSTVPEGPYCGTTMPDGYKLGWTCSAAACPAESGKQYVINDSDSIDSCGGSSSVSGGWGQSPSHDWMQMQNFPIYNSGSCPGTTVTGWTFNITGSVKHWHGSYTLATESGTWTAVANATANYFFTNGTSRTFTVTAAAAPSSNTTAPAQASGAGFLRNLSLGAQNNITIDAGGNTLIVNKGTAEHVKVNIKNLGSVTLQDVQLEAYGLPGNWMSLDPSLFSSLGQGETVTSSAVITIPDTAATGTYTFKFEAHNYYARAEYPITLTVVDRCDQCPASGAWSECADGKQTRTAYKCGSSTGYTCQEFTEESSCIMQVIVNNLPLLVVIVAIGAVLLYRFYWEKQPAAKPHLKK